MRYVDSVRIDFFLFLFFPPFINVTIHVRERTDVCRAPNGGQIANQYHCLLWVVKLQNHSLARANLNKSEKLVTYELFIPFFVFRFG